MTTKGSFIPPGQQSADASSKELPARVWLALLAPTEAAASQRPEQQRNRPQQRGAPEITRARDATAASLGASARLGKGGAAERAQIDAAAVGSGLGREVLGRIAPIRGRLCGREKETSPRAIHKRDG